jgi:hypothetical protein
VEAEEGRKGRVRCSFTGSVKRRWAHLEGRRREGEREKRNLLV